MWYIDVVKLKALYNWLNCLKWLEWHYVAKFHFMCYKIGCGGQNFVYAGDDLLLIWCGNGVWLFKLVDDSRFVQWISYRRVVFFFLLILIYVQGCLGIFAAD